MTTEVETTWHFDQEFCLELDGYSYEFFHKKQPYDNYGYAYVRYKCGTGSYSPMQELHQCDQSLKSLKVEYLCLNHAFILRFKDNLTASTYYLQGADVLVIPLVVYHIISNLNTVLNKVSHGLTEQISKLEIEHKGNIDKLTKGHVLAVDKELKLRQSLREEHELQKTELEARVTDLQDQVDSLPSIKLEKIRESKADFKIVCIDGEIQVHQLVLSTFWPFFETMTQNKCQETEQSCLKLEYSSDVVELLVAYLYGQAKEFDHEKAIPLLEISGVYDLPDLGKLAFKVIQKSEEKLVLQDCVDGWRSARLADHTEAKTFFTKLVVAKTKSEEDTEFDVMAKDEWKELFFDSLKIS